MSFFWFALALGLVESTSVLPEETMSAVCPAIHYEHEAKWDANIGTIRFFPNVATPLETTFGFVDLHLLVTDLTGRPVHDVVNKRMKLVDDDYYETQFENPDLLQALHDGTVLAKYSFTYCVILEHHVMVDCNTPSFFLMMPTPKVYLLKATYGVCPSDCSVEATVMQPLLSCFEDGTEVGLEFCNDQERPGAIECPATPACMKTISVVKNREVEVTKLVQDMKQIRKTVEVPGPPEYFVENVPTTKQQRFLITRKKSLPILHRSKVVAEGVVQQRMTPVVRHAIVQPVVAFQQVVNIGKARGHGHHHHGPPQPPQL